jgi:hypothetical protein
VDWQHKQEEIHKVEQLWRIETQQGESWPYSCVDDSNEEIEDEPLELNLDLGNRVFYTNLLPEPAEIAATSNISQQLAEAARENTKASTKVPKYLRNFEDVFSKKSFNALPERKIWDHAIELVPNSTPSNCKVYPLLPVEQKELDEFLHENLITGWIWPSKSPMASPVFFIKKKGGSLHLVQDYQVLNALTIKNQYLIPLTSELVNQLHRAKYFTKLDICWGYNNVHIKEGDKWKAAFQTNQGLFEPLVMFFRLTNSPATFQTMMNNIFHNLVAKGIVCIYLDDILVYTKVLNC